MVNTKKGHLGLKTGFSHFSAHVSVIKVIRLRQNIPFGKDGQSHTLILGQFTVFCV